MNKYDIWFKSDTTADNLINICTTIFREYLIELRILSDNPNHIILAFNSGNITGTLTEGTIHISVITKSSIRLLLREIANRLDSSSNFQEEETKDWTIIA